MFAAEGDDVVERQTSHPADSHRETLWSGSIFETEAPGAPYCITGTESDVI